MSDEAERAETEQEQGQSIWAWQADDLRSRADAMRFHDSYRVGEQTVDLMDWAADEIDRLRSERDRLVQALLDHACDCGPMDPDPAEHRETCPFREALEVVEGGGEDDLPPPWGEGVEPDEADRRAFGRLLEENTERVAAPQDADADGKVGGEKPLWRRLLALAYNMRNTDYNEIEWGHLDDTAEMLESAARRLRRGGGESGYPWTDEDVAHRLEEVFREERPGGSGERGEQYEGRGFTAGECIADALGEIHRWRRGAAGSTYDPLDHIEGRLRQALDRLRRSTPDGEEDET